MFSAFSSLSSAAQVQRNPANVGLHKMATLAKAGRRRRLGFQVLVVCPHSVESDYVTIATVQQEVHLAVHCPKCLLRRSRVWSGFCREVLLRGLGTRTVAALHEPSSNSPTYQILSQTSGMLSRHAMLLSRGSRLKFCSGLSCSYLGPGSHASPRCCPRNAQPPLYVNVARF